MRKRLTSIGNSLGLIIDKPILDLLGIDRDTVLEISTDGRRLVIQPVAREQEREVTPRREERPVSVREVGKSFLDELREAFK